MLRVAVMGGAEEGKPHNGRPSSRMLFDAEHRSNLRRYARVLVDLWKKISKTAPAAGRRVLVEQGPDFVRARACLVSLPSAVRSASASDRSLRELLE